MTSEALQSKAGPVMQRRGSDKSEGDGPSFSHWLRENDHQERRISRSSLDRKYSSCSRVSRLGSSRYEQDAGSYYHSLREEADRYQPNPSRLQRRKSQSPPQRQSPALLRDWSPSPPHRNMDGDNGSSLEHGDYGRSGLFSGSNLSRHGAVRRRGSDRPDPDHLLQRRNTRDAERRLAYSNFNDSGSHGFCE